MGKIIYLGGYKVNLQMEKEPVVNVAKWFLQNNDSIDSDSGNGNLKLQKLIYYAQCMHVAIFNTPMYSDKIEAWENGPVVREVYKQYRHYQLGPNARNEDPVKINALQEDVLRVINIVYGNKSANELIELTHGENPWKELKHKVDNHEDPEITISSIRRYYSCLKDVFEAFVDYRVEEHQYRVGNNIFTYQAATELTNEDKKVIDEFAYDMDNVTMFVTKDSNGGLVIY